MAQHTIPLALTYPDEWEKPFHVTHATGMSDIDSWLRTVWEDASSIVVGGGAVTLVTNLFTWPDPYYIICGRTGAVVTVSAGSVTITDGQFAWVTGVTRPMITEVCATVVAGAAPGPGWDRTRIPLLHRRGNNVYVFNNVIGLERVTVPVP